LQELEALASSTHPPGHRCRGSGTDFRERVCKIDGRTAVAAAAPSVHHDRRLTTPTIKHMNVFKKIALGAAAVSGAATLSLGILTASASPDAARPYQKIVTAIAEKFNLNADEVQAVFDENLPEPGESSRPRDFGGERPNGAPHMDRIEQAVEDGAITEAQAELLRAKLEATRPAFGEADGERPSREETEAAMTARADELKAWATENGIPEELVAMGPGMGRGRQGQSGNGQRRMR
jgi:hypothetical protein